VGPLDRAAPVAALTRLSERSVGVDVVDLLTQERTAVLEEAFAALQRSGPVHYEAAGERFTQDRLADLFDLVLTALRERRLEPVGAYCEDIAERRFEAGFGISEVQTAFNTLEEAMWQRVVAGVPAKDLVDAIGRLSTILGYGKDALARRYVSLAAHRHVPSLDLSALFNGVPA
jgi:hypothetical protein